MVGKPFYNFDTIGMFDEGGTQLHVWEPIALSGSAFCRCRTLRRNLTVIYAIPPA
jgi:hypothetical protein